MLFCLSLRQVGLSFFSNSSCTYFASHLYIALHCKKCLMDSFPFHASCHHRNNGNVQCYEIYISTALKCATYHKFHSIILICSLRWMTNCTYFVQPNINAQYTVALSSCWTVCAWEKEGFTVTGISRSNVFIPGRSLVNCVH